MTVANRMTWDGCAAEIGVNVRQLHAWRKEAGAPALPSPTAWRKWLANRSGATGRASDDADSEDDDTGASMPELKAEKLAEEIRKLKLVNDARDKRLKEMWRQTGIDAAGAILRRARGGLLGLLPSRISTASAGKSGPEIELIVRREVEAVLVESLKIDTEPA